MQYFEFLRTWKNKHQDPKLHETGKQRNKKKSKEQKKDKISLSFNKTGKGCVLDKNRKVLIIKFVQHIYKNTFITEGFF